MKKENAAFGAGCFWHVEDTFSKVNGVLETAVGYMGGHTENPTYEEVCSDKTGHVETVLVEYDPEVVSYKELLDIFWKVHDPTQLNMQGPDIGTQYRSAVFYYDEGQKNEALKSMEEEEKRRARKIVTEIIPAPTFYRAEDYHQRYFEKRGIKGCGV